MVLVDPYFTTDFWALGSLPLGLALDLLVGDPRGWPHPVRGIGWLIARAERGLRSAVRDASGGARAERLAGVVLVVVVVGLVASLAGCLTDVCDAIGGPATLIGRALMIYWALAIRSLASETLKASEAPSLFVARRELAMIVGRDTANLDATEIQRACVETIGENTNDAVVAPLFWLAVLGPAGLWGYKAINTLDSMVGYRNTRYRDFGWASARLDDLVNLAPARLTWLLIAVSAALMREDGLASLKIGWRDGRKHPSPNAAWGEAAIAGALGVRLGGPASYGGVATSKPYLGDPIAPIEPGTVRRAVRIMVVAGLHAALLALAARAFIHGG